MPKLNYEGDLPGTISVNPKTIAAPKEEVHKLGLAMSVPAAVIGGVMAPGAAALADPLIGRGLGGAAITEAVSPTESEAGLFVPLGRALIKGNKSRALKNGAKWIMSDQRELYEIPSSSFAKTFLKGGSYEKAKKGLPRLLKKYTPKQLYGMGLDAKQASKIHGAEELLLNHKQKEYGFISGLSKGLAIPEWASNVSKKVFKKDVEPNVGGYYGRGESVVSKFYGNKSKYNSSIHEANHAIQDTDPSDTIRDIAYRRRVPYWKQRHEIESRMAGERAAYPEMFTRADSPYGIHPEIRFDKNTGSFTPNREHLASTITYSGNSAQYLDRMDALYKEADRLNSLYKKDKDFRREIMKAQRSSEFFGE